MPLGSPIDTPAKGLLPPLLGCESSSLAAHQPRHGLRPLWSFTCRLPELGSTWQDVSTCHLLLRWHPFTTIFPYHFIYRIPMRLSLLQWLLGFSPLTAFGSSLAPSAPASASLGCAFAVPVITPSWGVPLRSGAILAPSPCMPTCEVFVRSSCRPDCRGAWATGSGPSLAPSALMSASSGRKLAVPSGIVPPRGVSVSSGALLASVPRMSTCAALCPVCTIVCTASGSALPFAPSARVSACSGCAFAVPSDSIPPWGVSVIPGAVLASVPRMSTCAALCTVCTFVCTASGSALPFAPSARVSAGMGCSFAVPSGIITPRCVPLNSCALRALIPFCSVGFATTVAPSCLQACFSLPRTGERGSTPPSFLPRGALLNPCCSPSIPAASPPRRSPPKFSPEA